MFKTTIASFLFTAAVAAGAQTVPSWDSGTYTYDGAGNIIAIGTDHYGYDALGRLVYGAAATPQSPANAQTYKYDRYGNLLKVETTSADGSHKSEFAVEPLTNQLTASCLEQDVTCMTASFDRAGNQLGLAGGTSDFQWDALGMMKELHLSTRHEQYVYDAAGERIVTIDVNSNTRRYSLRGGENGVARDALYEPQGDHWTWSRDYVYRNGMLISEFTASGQRHYHLDHLGTPRMITDSTGFKLATHKYWPFGQEAAGSTPDVADRMRFTGHERDAVPQAPGHDLDYMHARYYGPVMERFMSMDPVNNASPDAPQSWNRYSYTRNNPMALVDHNGKWPTRVIHTHQNAIDFTLRTLPASDRQMLKQAQVTADVDQQHQYKHAMRNPGQSPHDAATLANKYIDSAMSRAIALEKAGNHTGALVNVGLAMHTLQDNTSPMHMGVQEFDPGKGDSSPATLGHAQGELYDPSGMPQHEGVGENLDRATYDAYAHFAKATGLPVPPVPQCNGKPCFEPSGSIHIEVPPR